VYYELLIQILIHGYLFSVAYAAHKWVISLVFSRFPLTGVFIARGKEDALVTYNLVIGESVYGEKRISVEVPKQFFVLYNWCWKLGCIYSYLLCLMLEKIWIICWFIVCCMSCNLFLYSACMYVLCYEPRLNKSVFKNFYLNVVFIKLLL